MSAGRKRSRMWIEGKQAKANRLEAHARRRRELHQAFVEPWSTNGAKDEARYGGYVLRLGRLVWEPGTERPPFTVRPRMGRTPKRVEPIAAE